MYDCIDRWADYLGKEKGLSPNSITVYARHMRAAAEVIGDDPRVLDTDALRGWLHSAGGSISTFSSRISGLGSFYKWLVTTKQRMDNPMTGIDHPKQPKGLPHPVENLDITLDMLDELDRRANRNAATMKCLKPRKVGETRAMTVFLCETGLRISEAVKLKLPVPAPDHIRVSEGKGNKDAIIPLTPLGREAWNFLEGRWPINARGTQRRFAEAGFTPHQCRHWRGTSMSEAGCDLGDIQAMLRHASPATTLIYSAWATDRVRDALTKVPPSVVSLVA